MDICFRQFLERISPSLIGSGVCLDWTSVFIRRDNTSHILHVYATVHDGSLSFEDKLSYHEDLVFRKMEPMHETVSRAVARRSLLYPPRIVVDTLIDSRR